jgi:membrane protease YdiL (CAAX protease family)
MDPAPAPPPQELRPSGAFLILLVYVLALAAVLLVGAAFADDDSVGIPFVVAALVVGPLAALYVGLVRHAPREPTAAALRLLRPSGRELRILATTVVLGVALAPVTQALDTLLISAFEIKAAPEVAAELERMTGLIIVAAVLAQPVAEELLFRGFLLPRLAATSGRGTALLLVTGVYTLAQLQLSPPEAASALVLGGALGVAALASETAWVAIAGHVAHQAARIVNYPAWAAAVGAAVAAAIVAILARSRQS